MEESIIIDNMVCDCDKYQPLELVRKAISDRIKISRELKSQLTLIIEHPRGCKLFSCKYYGHLWQSSFAWNWGNKEYLFKVPEISLEDWLNNPYMSPDEMMIYSASMESYFNKNNFTDSQKPCRINQCTNLALYGDVLCKQHFIESLQSVGLLPKPPEGRIFAPYSFK